MNPTFWKSDHFWPSYNNFNKIGLEKWSKNRLSFWSENEWIKMGPSDFFSQNCCNSANIGPIFKKSDFSESWMIALCYMPNDHIKMLKTSLLREAQSLFPRAPLISHTVHESSVAYTFTKYIHVYVQFLNPNLSLHTSNHFYILIPFH